MKKHWLLASALFVAATMLSCDDDPVDPKLEVNKATIEATAAANEYAIGVESNGQWTASVTYTVAPAANWITLTGTPGENNGEIKVAVSANTATATRAAKVVVTTGDLRKEVAVEQAAADASLVVDTAPIDAALEGGNYTIAVTANTAWTAVVVDADEHDWVTLDDAEGTGNGEIKVTVAENETALNRNATIAVSTEGGTPQNVTVQQGAAGLVFSIDQTELNDVPTDGKTYAIAVTANVPWTATETSDFLVLSDASGTGNGTFTVKVGMNELFTPRAATVTVTPEGGNPVTVTVRQLAVQATLQFSDALTAGPITLLAGGGSKSGAVEASSGIEWKITSSAAWCKVDPATGIGSSSITILAQKANPSTSPQTATLTLSAVGVDGIDPVTLDVTQAGLVPQLAFQEWEEALEFPAEPADKRIWTYVVSNIQWTVRASETWLKVVVRGGTDPFTGGTNGAQFEVMAEANTTTSVRTAKLILEAATIDGVAPVEATFTQAAGEPPVPSVTVGGVTWATSNLVAEGTFGDAVNTQSAFFQFNSKIAWASTGTLSSTEGWTTDNQGAGDWLPANDPCPDGWHVPTSAELNKLVASAVYKRKVGPDGTTNVDNFATKAGGFWLADNSTALASATFENPNGCLFLPTGGYRNSSDASLYSSTQHGYYWGATGDTGYSPQMGSSYQWTTGSASVSNKTKNMGYAVRCAKDAE